MDGAYDGNYSQSADQAMKRRGIEDADDDAKIFVGGLSWETSVEDFKAYFEQFGTIDDYTIKTDPNTGRSRGFGFILFNDASSVDKVLAAGTHSLSGKNIDPKRAKPRGPEPVKKVFVGGLDPNTSEAEIRDYFGQYGMIEELTLPMDKMTGIRKPFAFVGFDSEQAVEQLCSMSKHTVGSKMVEVKKAVPKPEMGGGGRGGGFGGRGGRGDFGGPRGRGGRGAGRGGRFAGGGGGGYNQGMWDSSGYGGGYGGSPGYGGGYGAQSGYGGGYDYSGYQAPSGYAQPSSYGQQYGGYDYGWYGSQTAQNGGGYGRAARGGASDARYQPYSR